MSISQTLPAISTHLIEEEVDICALLLERGIDPFDSQGNGDDMLPPPEWRPCLEREVL
jgi:hypothetical protein